MLYHLAYSWQNGANLKYFISLEQVLLYLKFLQSIKWTNISSEDDAVSSASSLLRNNSQPSNEVLLRRYLFLKICHIIGHFCDNQALHSSFCHKNRRFHDNFPPSQAEISPPETKKRPPELILKVSEGWRLPLLSTAHAGCGSRPSVTHGLRRASDDAWESR